VEKNLPVPQSFLDQPELTQESAPYYLAFNEVSTSRQMGMGLGHIPYSEITGYLNENDIDHPEDRKRYRKFIVLLDNLYVKKSNEKSENKSKKKSPSPKRK